MSRILRIATFLLVAALPLAASAETVNLWGDDFAVTYNGATYADGRTTFSYTVCVMDHTPGRGFSHIVFGVSQCVPPLDVLEEYCQPSGCQVQVDPPTQVYGVKWEDSVGLQNIGECMDFSYAVSGSVAEIGTAIVTIKAGNCTGEGCSRAQITGPGCETIPTPTPTPTPPAEVSCNAGGPYLNVPCSDTPATIQLDGSGSVVPSEYTPAFSWNTNCPDGVFSAPDSAQTSLTFSTFTGDDVPVSCNVYLTIRYGEEQEVSCPAVVTVTGCGRDCLGVIGGPAEYDVCGVCDGDGSTCQCVDTYITGEVNELNVDFNKQCTQTRRMLKRYGKTPCSQQGKGKRVMKQMRSKMRMLCAEGRVKIKSIPTLVSSCVYGECTLCDNLVTMSEVRANAVKLYKVSRRAAKLRINCGLSSGPCLRSAAECQRSAQERVRANKLASNASRRAYNDIIQSSRNIPSSTFDCSGR